MLPGQATCLPRQPMSEMVENFGQVKGVFREVEL